MIGKTLGRYRIVEKLGEGGMGAVYRADDVVLGRPVAVKLMPDGADTAAVSQLWREAQAASALNQPGICTIYSYEEQEGRPFIVMELLEGRTLAQEIGAGPIEIERLVSIATDLTRALEAAHFQGILHRDIKPSNIFLTRAGEVKILDFGLARMSQDARLLERLAEDRRPMQTPASAEVSWTGLGMGTAAYMSPEQVGMGNLDPRTDLYSLGAVLYEMATGRRAFLGDDLTTVIDAVRDGTFDPPRSVNPKLPESLERIILKAMSHDPEKRYRRASELQADLERFAHDLAAAPRAVTAEQRIAVLPFGRIGSDDPRDAFGVDLADGVREILTALPALSVIAPGSSARCAAAGTDPQTAGRKLAVDTLLHGRVLADTDEPAVRVELLRVGEKDALWIGEYDARDESGHVLAERIASDLTERLGLPRVGKLHGSSANEEAWRLYLQGRRALSGITMQGMAQAVGCFQEALRIDPGFARAHAGLAEALANPTQAEAKRHVAEALALDPQLAEAHSVRGYLRMTHDWDWDGAELSFRRALELESDQAGAHLHFAELLSVQGRFEQSFAAVERALELDPRNTLIQAFAGFSRIMAGRMAEAQARLEGFVEGSPDEPLLQAMLALTLLCSGKFEQATEHARRSEGLPGGWATAMLAPALARAGRAQESEEAFSRLLGEWKAGRAFTYFVATAHGLAGNRDRALEWLERAYRDHSWGTYLLRFDPSFRELHDDPRFQRIVERIFPAAPSRSAEELGPERFRRARELFERAMELPPEERAGLLEAECSDDAAVRARVERLIDESQDISLRRVRDAVEKIVRPRPDSPADEA